MYHVKHPIKSSRTRRLFHGKLDGETTLRAGGSTAAASAAAESVRSRELRVRQAGRTMIRLKYPSPSLSVTTPGSSARVT
jgi:hypothetical protein